jgi:hypothetical protein
VGAVENAPVDEVLDAMEFENFTKDYGRAFVKLNQKEG